MIEFANIYTYDLNTVILAGPAILLVAFALATAWANHVPSRVSAFEFAPAFGL